MILPTFIPILLNEHEIQKRIHLDEDDLRLVKEIYNKFTEPLALFLEVSEYLTINLKEKC